ncbi:PAAR domain-containing protein [Cobetia marina]|uniref:PAAR domain-containing protein n=1 Tax=Cobetia marina TaxID=28258 RepID=UPI0025480568|nr:PAAR domain-containing protein [Cobetia pacifica]MDI6005265.1 PAAR domain-containing protein [Cobetia pacifica]
MFSSGDGVIVLGDSTTHGGKVMSAQSNYLLEGKPVAFYGCHTACGAALISAASGKHGLG